MDVENQEKIARYLNYLQQDEYNVSLLLELYNCYLENQYFDEAQACLDRAKAAADTGFLGEQGILYLKRGFYDQAYQVLKQNYHENDNPKTRYVLAHCLFFLEKYPEALALIRDIEADQEIDFLKAQLFYMLDDYEAALAILDDWQQRTADPLFLSQLCIVSYEMGLEDQARDYAQLSLSTCPNDENALFVLAMLRAGTEDSSEEEFNVLMQTRFVDDYRLWFANGLTLLKEASLADARQALEESLHRNKDFYDGWLVYAWCLILQNELNDAHNAYKKAVAINSDFGDAWAGLGLVKAMEADFPKAEYFIGKAHALNYQGVLCDLASSLMSSSSVVPAYEIEESLQQDSHFSERLIH